MLSDKSLAELSAEYATLSEQLTIEKEAKREEITLLEDAIRTTKARITDLKRSIDRIRCKIGEIASKKREIENFNILVEKRFIIDLEDVLIRTPYVRRNKEGVLYTKLKKDDCSIALYHYVPIKVVFVAKVLKNREKYFFTLSLKDAISNEFMTFLDTNLTFEFASGEQLIEDCLLGKSFEIDGNYNDIYIILFDNDRYAYQFCSFTIELGVDVHIQSNQTLFYEIVEATAI